MHWIKSLFPQKLKNIYHLMRSVLANIWFGFPSRKIKVIGVTGTNGKTTTVQMIVRILEESSNPVKSATADHGARVAMASTINFKLGEKEWVNKTKFTTLSPFAVQKFIREAVDAKCDYFILETSSHSLDQYRVWGVNYHTAVITNVTREHLDYHETMEKYRKAKMKLFAKAKMAIVNLDMEKPEEFLQGDNIAKYGYTTGKQDRRQGVKIVKAENIELKTKTSQFKVENLEFKINLPGLFNIENSLAAVCVGLAENISLENIAKALEKIQGVSGRMEYVPNDKGMNIIVDYAVTPDSLEKLYQLIKQINTNKNKIIAVFGSCGERDRGKRPMMGEIVSRYADYVIVTNEDPYYEEPMKIIDEVFSGIVKTKKAGDSEKESSSNFQFPNPNLQTNSNDQNLKSQKIEGVNCWRILDRREAIKKALELARPGDFVLVTGKGAEETMAIKDQRIPWNDKGVILKELTKI